jgi:tetratricopeptide (TPR) repeat protein
VCDADLDTLASLLDKSLLRRRTGRLGEERYWMLETIREFAAERLEESGEAESVRRRHAERMLEIAKDAHLSEDDDEPFDFDTVLAERDDLRGALDWAAEHNPVLGLELAVELEGLWGTHVPAEGVRRLEALLTDGQEFAPRLRARALRALAGAAHQEGVFEIADPAYEESLRIFTELGDERGMATLWIRYASRAHERGDLDLARRFIEDCDRVAKDRFRAIEAQANLFLGRFAMETNDLEEAEAYLDRSRELASDLDWGWWEAMSLTLLLDVARRRGDLEVAERHALAALAIYAAEESRGWCVNALGGLAQVVLAQGDLERAGWLWGATSAEGERHPGPWEARKARWAGALVHENRPEFLAAVVDGRELELWDAVAIALGEGEGDDAQTVP